MTIEQIGEKLYKTIFPVSQKVNMNFCQVNPHLIQWETDLCNYQIRTAEHDMILLSAHAKQSGKMMMHRTFKVSGEKITQIDHTLDKIHIPGN